MSNNSIAELIRRLAGDMRTYCKVATVTAVNDTARTVDVEPIDETAPIIGVNLTALQSGDKGVIMIPAIGSDVIVAMTSATNGVVIATCEVDKVLITIGTTTIEATDGKIAIDAELIEMNGGNNGGLVKLSELNASLNSIKQYCEQMKQATITGLNAVGASLASSGAAGAAAFSGAMTAMIELKDMENEKVTH